MRLREVAIHYAEGPCNGPPLVLLHGIARDWKSFGVLLPELSAQHHIFALDFRGHGASGRVARGYRMHQFASDVVEFFRTMLPNGAAVFGHSLGGMVGLEVAADPGCKVRALIIGDAMISSGNLAHSLYAPLFLQLHELLLQGGTLEELTSRIGKIRIRVPGIDELVCIEDLPGNGEATLREWARGAMHTDPDALAMTLEGSAFIGWDPEGLLGRITCPVLLLQANPELDALLTDADVRLAMKLLRAAEHVRFPLLGHALFLQQPKPVLRAVHDFLARVG
ncbi:MAG TPA: alpha/beta hydrolase [Terriglobales bacterium]|nr:alpha/beta hydrolase [Terriglobales bacterium]